MSNKFKKSTLIILSILVLSLMLVGCSKSESEDESVTLTLMATQSDVGRPYIKTAIANYEEKTGNKIDIQGVPDDSGDQVMLTKFATGDIPDILMNFAGHRLKPFDVEKNFYDFSDAEWVEDVLPHVKDQAMVDGKVYGLPHWEASISGMVYNKEIFDKLALKVPTTQTEFMEVCEEIKNSGVTPLYVAFKDAWPLFYQFPLDSVVNDPDVLAQLNTNEIKYADIPEVRKMVEWYKEIADKGYIGEKFTTNTWDYTPEALGSEDYAMAIIWDTWLYTDLEPSYPEAAEKFGLMPAFMGTPEQGTFEGPNVCLTLANKNSENKEVAIEFVNFLARPENYNIAFDGINTAPVFKGQTTHVATPQYEEAVEWIDKVGNPSIASVNIVGFSSTEGAKALQDLMLGSKSVDECIDAMDASRMRIAKSQQEAGF